MKFLFYPVPSHGHLNPLIPLLEELVSRGEEVVVHVTREFETTIRHTGASPRLLADSLIIPSTLAGGARGPRHDELGQRIIGIMSRGLRETPRLLAQARAEQADCIVYDPMALWGRAIAGMLPLPKAIFHTTVATSHSPAFRRELGKTTKALPPARILLRVLELLLTSEVLHWRHGLPRVGMGDMPSAVEDLNLVPVPRAYQPDAHLFDERFLFVGPSVLPRDEREDFPLEQLDGKPVLLIALGTTPMNQRPDFYKACFEAFGDTRWQVVLACGKGVEPASLGPVPSNILVRQQVPQLDVLQRTRVFLTHGGMNSIMESLWHGVPLVVFPRFGDQLVNAARVSELGLGLSLTASEALEPKVLRETIERLDTDPSYRARVAGFQKELREAGGHRRAAEALQQYVASRRRG